MRAVVQRVSAARVLVGGIVIGEIAAGLCVLAGAIQGDGPEDLRFIARKLATLRIFPDADGRMNLSVKDSGGGVLLISQFTLAADTTSGTRPSFSAALDPELAAPMIDELADALREFGLTVSTGNFGAKMTVELSNDGPVTIVLDSKAKQRK